MNGIILINKEKEYTSHDVVNIVKKLLNEKVGHTGTLDPNATGVLPLLIGEGTKLSKYLINHDKEYIATLSLGEKRDTADAEGKVIEKKEIDKSIYENNNKKIKEVLNSFLGKGEQIPPMYSAIKVNGKKLYEYAREEKSVELKPRKIEIYNIELLKVEDREIIFKVKVSKGTYIRTLCEDIAERLNTCGYMKELERTEVGDFKIKNAIKIKDLKEEIKQGKEIECFLSIEKIIKKYLKLEEIKIEEKKYNKYLNGMLIDIDKEDGFYAIYQKNIFTGIGIVNNNKLKRDLVI